MFNTDYYNSRYFNQIMDLGDTLVKRSDNVEKIKAEYKYYYLLPTYLQRFFVQPFNLTVEENWASYEMEKIPTFNAAQMLLSNSMDEESFKALIGRVMDFHAKGGPLESNVGPILEQSRYLVIDKTKARLEGQGYDEYIDRLEKAYTELIKTRTTWFKSLSHGDLCLSNMIWIRELGMLKFIDPRGAQTSEDLFLDEYYDLAKLAHSVFSNYEVMVYGIGEMPEFTKDVLTSVLNSRRISLDLLKVYEAGLFLSMIPLHAEDKNRMEAFKDTADYILNSLGF